MNRQPPSLPASLLDPKIVNSPPQQSSNNNNNNNNNNAKGADPFLAGLGQTAGSKGPATGAGGRDNYLGGPKQDSVSALVGPTGTCGGNYDCVPFFQCQASRNFI
jgi:hypothetical protein